MALTAAYLTWRWLRNPDWTTALLAGLACGLAMLAAFAWIGLLAALPLLWIAARWRGGVRRSSEEVVKPGLRPSLAQLAIAGIAAVYVINLTHLFEGILTPLGEFRFSSQMLIGQDDDITGYTNRFHKGAFAEMPVPLPQAYVLGLDAWLHQSKGCPDGIDGGASATSLGRWHDALGEAARDTPIPLWLLAMLGILWPKDLTQPRDRLNELAIWLPMGLAFTLMSLGPGCPDPHALGFCWVPFAIVALSTIGSAATGRSLRTALIGTLAASYAFVCLLTVFGGDALRV